MTTRSEIGKSLREGLDDLRAALDAHDGAPTPDLGVLTPAERTMCSALEAKLNAWTEHDGLDFMGALDVMPCGEVRLLHAIVVKASGVAPDVNDSAWLAAIADGSHERKVGEFCYRCDTSDGRCGRNVEHRELFGEVRALPPPDRGQLTAAECEQFDRIERLVAEQMQSGEFDRDGALDRLAAHQLRALRGFSRKTAGAPLDQSDVAILAAINCTAA